MSRRRLRQSPRPRLRQRTVLIYAAAVTLVTIAIGVAVFVYMNLGNSQDSLANRNREEVFTSSGTSDWEDAATWQKSQPRMDDTPGNDVRADTVNINGYITRTGSLRIRKNSTITVIDTLRITGDLRLDGDSELVVEENGLLIVEGDFTAQNKSNTQNNGGTVVMNTFSANGSQVQVQNNDQFYVFNQEGSSNLPSGTQTESQLIENNMELYEFASGMTVMPITLAYFRAEQEGEQTLLEWGTVNEENNDFFTIERSRDGKLFEILDRVTGAGNSDVELDYEYVDDQPLSGPNYYRLKQTDYNGDFEYFNIVLVHHDEIAGNSDPINIDRIGPNPFQQQFTVYYTIREASDVSLTITNANGQQVANASHRAYAGSNEIKFLEGTQLNPGIYLVTLSYGNYTSEPVRLIKR